MTEQPKIKQFQIWKEVDPRFERFIRIESVGVGRRSIGLRTVVLDDGRWVDGPRSRMSYADPERIKESPASLPAGPSYLSSIPVGER